MTILLADDDRVQTLMIAGRLRASGQKVIVAHDAMQAWTAAIQNLPDAIVLDIQMPGGTGVNVLKQLKTSTKTNQIPVVVLSGSLDANAAETVRKMGADVFLPKPVNLKRLFSALSKLLNSPLEAPDNAV